MAGYLGRLETRPARGGIAGAAAADDVRRRRHHGRHGAALSRSAWSNRARPAAPSWRSRSRPRMRRRQGRRLRHGRHHRQALPARRSRARSARASSRSARVYRFVKGSGLPVRIPVIELVEIGAGGGSIARLDALGRIKVGPDSRRQRPGPGLLRPRRHRTHRDRRRPRARPSRSRAASPAARMPLDPDDGRRRARRRIGRRAGHRRRRARRRASPRSSTRTWRMPPACMPSRTARTPPSAR